MSKQGVRRPSLNKAVRQQTVGKVFKPRKMAHLERQTNANCEGCTYWDADGLCVYILVEMKRRGVPMWPGGGCEKKTAERKPDENKFILTDKQKVIARRSSKTWSFDVEAAALYYDCGDSDVMIANKLHCKKQAILEWRQATGRRSNSKLSHTDVKWVKEEEL